MTDTPVNLSGEARPVVEGLFRVPADGGPPRMIGGKCRICGVKTVMVRAICPGCWAEKSQDEIFLARHGTLYAFTVIHQSPTGFDAPYSMGYVDLESGLRVLARVTAYHPALLRAGATVEFSVGPLGIDSEGRTLIGPIFHVAGEGETP